MELKEFVKTVITQLVEGVIETQKEVENKGAYVNPIGFCPDKNTIMINQTYHPIGIVAFEVGLTTTSAEEKTGKVNVFLSVVGGGTESAKGISNEAVTRIKFSIPVMLPVAKHSEHKIKNNEY
jgi:hypothetical protein